MPQYENIPDVLKTYRQWIVWRYEETDGEKPTKVPYNPKTGLRADVNAPDTWADFAEARIAAETVSYWSGLGFVLTDNDPFAFIDLDMPKRKPNQSDADFEAEKSAVMERQRIIYEEIDSYAELSPGGGLHIIPIGSVPSGRRRGSIEVYSSQRYMTMTGNVYRNAPVKDCGPLLQSLWETLGKAPNTALASLGLEKEKAADETILQWANNAANAQKFKDLFYDGNWQQYYPSQSEADFALVDILAFYSGNRVQVQRLFLSSRLGQRDKSRAQYRINYMLNRCFDRMLPPIDIEGLQNQLRAAVEAQQKEQAKAVQMRYDEAPPDLISPAPSPSPIAEDNPYSVPPGLVGMVAQFIYAQAPRPVAEIALIGALGLIAGIAGRAYNVSNTGLNGYFLSLASTGSGKEAIASGISKLINRVAVTVPPANDFVGPSEISSAPALVKYLGNKSIRFVSIVGEFGIALKQMSNQHAPAHLMMLKRILLDLYNKSGRGSVMRPTIYSDKDKNTASLAAPAFSMIGESTPERFYDALDEDMITEGFLPRFTIIEYKGGRVPLNEFHALAEPPHETVEVLANLCAQCLNLDSRQQVIDVQFDPQAESIMSQFNIHCDAQLNATEREVTKNLWNRAHVKAMKLAALVAVGCHPYAPVINADHAMWATKIVLEDVRNIQGRFESGEVGAFADETKQVDRMVRTFRDYVIKPWSEISGYKVATQLMHSEKVIPYSYIYKRCAQVAAFQKSRMGARQAITNTIKTLIDRGDIRELTKSDSASKFNSSAACYMITNPKAFGL